MRGCVLGGRVWSWTRLDTSRWTPTRTRPVAASTLSVTSVARPCSHLVGDSGGDTLTAVWPRHIGVLLWSSYGPLMVLLWSSYGPLMVLLWSSYGPLMVYSRRTRLVIVCDDFVLIFAGSSSIVDMANWAKCFYYFYTRINNYFVFILINYCIPLILIIKKNYCKKKVALLIYIVEIN